MIGIFLSLSLALPLSVGGFHENSICTLKKKRQMPERGVMSQAWRIVRLTTGLSSNLRFQIKFLPKPKKKHKTKQNIQLNVKNAENIREGTSNPKRKRPCRPASFLIIIIIILLRHSLLETPINTYYFMSLHDGKRMSLHPLYPVPCSPFPSATLLRSIERHRTGYSNIIFAR